MRLVLDLYNPVVVEVLEAVAARPARAQRRIQSLIASRSLAQLAAADFVVCASERQRDLWLGGMALSGLIELDAYRRDPTLRSLVDVVPFGIPAEPPRPAAESPLRAAFPAIGPDDRVLLWAGGLWGWLDPETAIRATAMLDRTHLVVMGTGRPGPARTGQEPFAERALELARREGLEGECVHFNPGWVPYAERGAWLLDADLGVTAHRDHLEARYSFRTRVLDYLWAGLPVVASRGDGMAALVEREGLGRTARAGRRRGLRRGLPRAARRLSRPGGRPRADRDARPGPALGGGRSAARRLVLAHARRRPARAGPARAAPRPPRAVPAHAAEHRRGARRAGRGRQVARRLRRALGRG